MTVDSNHKQADHDQEAIPKPQCAHRQLKPTETALPAERDRPDDTGDDAWREKEEFLSFVAHEVRNPLVPIQNAVELLRLQTATGQQKQRAIEIIELQVLELRRVLDDLLD